MSPPLLRTEGLEMRFGGLRAVADVDFAAPTGRITAIIGPNGAGKTTFFNLVSGFCTPRSGRVYLAGDDVTGLPPHRMARRGVARTFQTTKLFPEGSVLDNVIVGCGCHTRSNVFDAVLRTPRLRREVAESRSRALDVLERTGVAELADRPVAEISQEARKRVAIALALATEPRLLLLDEPAAGINAHETEGISELIRSIADGGVTICLVEHKMRMVMGLSHHIVVLNHGRKIAEGSPEQIRSDPEVVRAYLGGAQDA